MDIGAQLRVIVAEPASELAPEPAAERVAEQATGTGAATEESSAAGSPGVPAAEGDPGGAGGTLRR